MSGTRSPLKTAPATESLWKLGALLWPFVAGAVAINLFLLGLIFHSAGWTGAMAPATALLWALPMSLPATWAAALWLRSLIRAAEKG